MRTVFAIYLTLFGFLVIPSLSDVFTGQEEDKQAVSVRIGKEGRDSAKIARFLIEMTDSRLMDMEEGRLAAERGTTQEVRDYGQLMLTGQPEMLEKLKALAAEHGVVLPVSISRQKAKSLEALKAKTGEDFDRKFMRMIKADHKRDVKLCKKIKKVNNEEINKFVNTYQPIIEIHLQRAKQLRRDYEN